MLDYDQFLTRAGTNLLRSGARPLLPAAESAVSPAWTNGWDRIFLLESPGAHTLYAFTNASGMTLPGLGDRLNHLTDGLMSSGFATQPGLRLVAVVVYPTGLDGARRRQITSLAPRTYYANLRPSTWAVDLAGGRVYTGGLVTPEGRELMVQAVEGGACGDLLDEHGVEVLQQQHGDRVAAFYQIMRSRQPVVTYALIAVNVALFALLYVNGGPTSDATLQAFGALSPRLIEGGQWWRVVTSMFLHASVPHILFNMTSLFAVGTLAERLYGSLKYLAIYLGAGLIGSLASFGYAVATGRLDVLGVGASGAIFGVAGALLTLPFQSSNVIPPRLRRRISTSLLPLVLLSLVISYLTPNVDNGAHIGGLLGGIALSFLFPLIREVPRPAGAGR